MSEVTTYVCDVCQHETTADGAGERATAVMLRGTKRCVVKVTLEMATDQDVYKHHVCHDCCAEAAKIAAGVWADNSQAAR